MPKITSVRPFLFIGLVLSILGWVGLLYVIINTLPTLGPRWLFFFFLVLGFSGSAMPVIAFLHLRFQGDSPYAPGVVIRQSIWVGIYAGLLAWLQLGRVLDTARAVFLAVGFILIEILVRLRERSRFNPQDSDGK
jgi:hypothetical protein